MTKRILRKALGRFDRVKKTKEIEIPGMLGFTINNVQTVAVANRPGFVWVRLRNNLNEPIKAYNDVVSNVYNLPVVVIRDDEDRTRYRVKGKDQGVYQNWGGNSYIPIHGNQHSFDPDSGGGGDVTFVHNRQFTPLLASPSGSAGSPYIIIHPFSYYQGITWHYAGGTGTTSLLPYKPTGSNARMVLVYLDNDGNPQLLPGSTYFVASITGNAAVLPYVPALGSATDIPIAAVRLVSGTSIINWDNLYDLRPLIVSDGFIPTGTSGHVIQDDGVSQTNRAKLNFVGSGFNVYDDVGNGATVVSGTAGSTVINNYGSTNPLAIFDDHVFKVSGTAIDFTTDLTVAVTGSVAYVSSTATGGTGSSTYPPSWKYDINSPKASADTPDDDFTATTLNAKWTVVGAGAVGTVSLVGERYNPIYDLTSVPGYLAVQTAFSGTSKLFQIRQDFTIPVGASIILAVNANFLMQGAGTLSATELQVGLAINNNDNGYSTGTWVGLFLEARATGVRIWFSDFSADYGIMSAPNLIGHQIYLRIHKIQSTEYQGFVSVDGISWIPMGDTGLIFADPNNIWIFVESKAAMADPPPIPIQLFDWIRQGTANVHPW